MRTYLMSLCVLVGLLLSGCADQRGSLPPGGTAPSGQHVSGIFLQLGTFLTWGGGAVVAASLLALGASFLPYFVVFLGGLRTLIIEAVVLGMAAILIGSGFLWLGNHPWVLAVTTGLVVIALAVRYRTRLLALLGLGGATAPAVTEITPKV